MRATIAVLALIPALLVADAATGNAAPTARTYLRIAVWPDGPDGAVIRWTLRCAPARGTLPERAAACRRLAAADSPFKPVPDDAVCTRIYGGPDVARVSGTFRGRRLRAVFNKLGGCEIARWNRVAFLLRAMDTRAPSTSTAATDLRIAFWPKGPKGRVLVRWTLRCKPVGGTLPDRRNACRRLSPLTDPFKPVPDGAVCTQIYGGPQVARITGTFRGRRVSATFNRLGGCEITRWDRVAFLFRTPR